MNVSNAARNNNYGNKDNKGFKIPDIKNKNSDNNLNNQITNPKVNGQIVNPTNPTNPANPIDKKESEKIIPDKIKKPRLKLDEKTLLYTENGIKKFYEIVEKTEFKEKSTDVHNLNKLIMLFKNWHFMLFPKYDTDFFISKITELGKKPSTKAYLSRLRKIYKGEENWDVIYNQQDEILTNPHLAKNANKDSNYNLTSPNLNKLFSEDNTDNQNSNSVPTNPTFNFNFNLNKTNLSNQLNRISKKLDNVEITNDMKKDTIKIDNNNIIDETDVQEVFFQDIPYDNNQIVPDINEQDFDNFDHFYDDNHNKNNHSETGSIYKREKRLYSDAFAKSEDNKSVGGVSANSQSIKTSKKMKLN